MTFHVRTSPSHRSQFLIRNSKGHWASQSSGFHNTVREIIHLNASVQLLSQLTPLVSREGAKSYASAFPDTALSGTFLPCPCLVSLLIHCVSLIAGGSFCLLLLLAETSCSKMALSPAAGRVFSKAAVFLVMCCSSCSLCCILWLHSGGQIRPDHKTERDTANTTQVT